jgi:hypothetical protein
MRRRSSLLVRGKGNHASTSVGVTESPMNCMIIALHHFWCIYFVVASRCDTVIGAARLRADHRGSTGSYPFPGGRQNLPLGHSEVMEPDYQLPVCRPPCKSLSRGTRTSPGALGRARTPACSQLTVARTVPLGKGSCLRRTGHQFTVSGS